MSDQSIDFGMGHSHPVTSESPKLAARIHKSPKREYYAYFALIFAATLPLALFTWALATLRQFKFPQKGPFARAWSQARIITPMIFHG